MAYRMAAADTIASNLHFLSQEFGAGERRR